MFPKIKAEPEIPNEGDSENCSLGAVGITCMKMAPLTADEMADLPVIGALLPNSSSTTNTNHGDYTLYEQPICSVCNKSLKVYMRSATIGHHAGRCHREAMLLDSLLQQDAALRSLQAVYLSLQAENRYLRALLQNQGGPNYVPQLPQLAIGPAPASINESLLDCIIEREQGQEGQQGQKGEQGQEGQRGQKGQEDQQCHEGQPPQGTH